MAETGWEALPAGFGLSMSPDGTALAYVATGKTERGLRVAFLDGRPARDLPVRNARFYVWASETVLLVGERPLDERRRTCLVHRAIAATGETAPWMRVRSAASLASHPDAGCVTLLEERGERPRLAMLDAEAGRRKPLHSFDDALIELRADPTCGHRWSSDGARLLVTGRPPGAVEPPADANVLIGSDYQRLRHSFDEETARRCARRLYALERDGGWWEVPDSTQAFWAAFTPDGRAVVYTRRDPPSGISLNRAEVGSGAREVLGAIGGVGQPVLDPAGWLHADLDDPDRPGVRGDWRRIRV